MSVNDDVKFEDVFRISTIALRIYRCHPAIPRNTIWKMQFTVIMITSVICFGLLFNTVIFHDIPSGKFSEASKNSIMAIVAITITFKYIILLRHQDSIMHLIRIIDEDYELAKEFSQDEQLVVTEYSLKGVWVCKLWFISATATSALFPLKAFILMGYHYYTEGDFQLLPMFDITYPSFIDVHKNDPAVYFGLFVLCLMFDCYASTIYIGFDPLVPIFLLHACGQMEMISRRILKLLSGGTTEEEVHENFKKCIQKLQEIYGFVGCVKANFTALYEYNMKATTFLLPLTAFQIVESLRHKVVNLEFLAFLTGVLMHFYMPCYHSDLLMEKSENLRQAIYSCGWEQRPERRVRRTVLFMLSRATLPLVISTVFYPICLDTFAEMCRQSYAIFNIMNAAWT